MDTPSIPTYGRLDGENSGKKGGKFWHNFGDNLKMCMDIKGSIPQAKYHDRLAMIIAESLFLSLDKPDVASQAHWQGLCCGEVVTVPVRCQLRAQSFEFA